MGIDKKTLKELNNAWLTKYIKPEDIPNFNPLSILCEDSDDNFQNKLTWLLVQPEYFSFLCKHVFNVELLPFQAVMLQELWNRKFPMMIATRGFGKLLKTDEKIRIRNGWTTMGLVAVGDYVYGGDGNLTQVTAKTDLQTDVNMFRIDFEDGRFIECCEDHQWRVYDKRWVVMSTKDMFSKYEDGRFAIPASGPLSQETIPVEESAINVARSRGLHGGRDKIFITSMKPSGKSDGYCITVDNEDSTYITKDYLVTHNSWLLGLYSLVRALLMPDRKIIVAGAAFRQSRFVHEYMETIWKNAPVLRDLCDQDSGPFRSPDMCRMIINGSTVTAIPIGNGDKIRGYRAQDLLVEEYASHNKDIFDTVLAGFGNVSAAPAEKVRRMASEEMAKERGISLSSLGSGNPLVMGNQIVLCGTAYYEFNHFASDWKRYKAIIESRGNVGVLEEIFGGNIPEGFNWRDYSIIRIPYEILPKGFMDEGNVARSKASVHSGIFQMEYNAVFCSDSNGFFKRSLIESCVADGDALLKGSPDLKYIMAIDPASEIDNFSIIILEMHASHRRIVHCWTTTRKSHIQRVASKLTSEDNFYSYCGRKIRELMQSFNIVHIALDSQGGGIAVSEALHESSNLKPGEVPIWPVIGDKSKPSDDLAGLHILEMVNFASSEWMMDANHGLRKDFEDKTTLFPRFDPVILGLSAEQDRINNKLYDTLEDCVMEIEELKTELSLIEITRTPSGREHWSTPDTKVGKKKGKMRKDRYSALIMANYSARRFSIVKEAAYQPYGGFSAIQTGKKEEVSYTGPAWFTNGIKGVY